MKNTILSKKQLYLGLLAVAMLIAITGILSGKGIGFVTIKQNPFLEKLADMFGKFTQSPTERVYLQTDKPLYEPGETIWFSAWVVNTKDIKASDESNIIHVQLINPKGGIENEMKIIADKGSAGGDFNLGSGIAGGIYKIKAYTTYQGTDRDLLSFEKEIQVQTVILPRLKMKMDFERKAYGPGDAVQAKVQFSSLDNKPIAKKDINWIFNLDGQQFLAGKGKTDDIGLVTVNFKLPADLKTNDGLLGVLIEHEGRTESISRSVPIVLNKINLSFYPEGGDMVANLECKVAFRAINEFNKAADIEGIVEDDLGNELSHFSSYHFGMGSFNLVPVPGRLYHVKITRPEGIKETYPLPSAQIAGYTLQVPYTNNKEALEVTVKSTVREELSLVATVRDKVCFQGAFDAEPGDNRIEMSLHKFPAGVAQITLFDSKGTPRAERLVFVNRAKQLKIAISTDKQKYQPREKVEMKIKTTDENGHPVPANISLAVVDDKLLSFADDRSGTILSRLYLEPELKEKVEEAAFYFNPEEPKADTAMDYLMLTSGWRRFTWKQVLNGEFPANPSKPEQSVIAGKVTDQETGHGIPEKKMELIGTDNNLITYTDRDGRYKFRLSQFTGPVTITMVDTAYVKNPVYVSNFSDNQNITCESNATRRKLIVIQRERPEYFVEYDKATGMNVYASPNQGMVYEWNANKRVMNLRGNRKSKAMANPGPDIIPDLKIEKGPDFKNIQGFISDDRSGEIYKQVQINNTWYYRARQFPSPTYNTRKNDEARTDFRSTIFWKNGIETDEFGNATVSFYNSDDVTAFRATAEGIGAGMAGHTESLFYTQLPFSINAKIPDGAAVGDEVKIPVSLTNNTGETISGGLTVIGLHQVWQPTGNTHGYDMFASTLNPPVSIGPNSTKTVMLTYTVLNKPGKDTLRISFQSKGQHDEIVKEVHTAERGFPEMISFSGQDKDNTYSFDLGAPLEGSLHAEFTAYPSSLNETMSGLDAILREPYGCFEQTSSSNYPNIIALMYMRETGDRNEALQKRASDLLDQGYKKLVTFETPDKGYEWFGSSPGHEALTAYGLMEFNDMKEVYASVDKSMVERTANWLLKRRNNNGGFMRDGKALDNFGRASEAVTNAYIVYALTEGGYLDIKPQIEAALTQAEQSGDAYELALMANTLKNTDDARADKIMKTLIGKQLADGSWTGKQSITCSGGKELIVETSSLAVMAMMKDKNADRKPLENGVKFLIKARDGGGGWGSTQTTVLALKALARYSRFSKHTPEPGTITIMVDGKEIASQSYKAGETNDIKLAGLEKHLSAGKHQFRVKYSGTKYPLPYTVSIKFRNVSPSTDAACKVNLSTHLMNNAVKTGETVRLSAVLKNQTHDGQPMTIAILGIPAGLSAQPWQLKELQEKGVYDFYEIKGNNVVVYYRQMKPDESHTINLDLKAEIPGTYQAPASEAYLYYTSENKSWCKAEGIVVKP